MSDCVRPHRQQPTRFPCPRDSPGKNTGVRCHLFLQSVKAKSESEVTQLCLTLCRTPHLNKKQNKNTNPISRRQEYHLLQPYLSEGKKKQANKNSTQISPYTKAYRNQWTNFRKKPKRRKNTTFFKERIQLSLKPGKRRPQTQ